MAPWFNILAKLKMGLGTILVFIGLKMALEPLLAVPVGVSLAVILAILVLSVFYIKNRKPIT